MKSLGEKIRALRENKKLPLRKVAAYLDIDQAILSKIERGLRKATREQVVKLANYFNIVENELLVLWLADRLVYELTDKELALQALKIAEEKVAYQTSVHLDKRKISDIIRQVLSGFKSVKKAWIFGSFARDTEGPSSDIDILIDVPPNEEFTLFDIAEIQESIQNKVRKKVDVVMVSAILPKIKKRINPDLKLIYEV
jgi:predicted nucleotidyltransferase/plasmid maintenance system antidote protein VapI